MYWIQPLSCTVKLHNGCMIVLVVAKRFKIIVHQSVSAYFSVTCNYETWEYLPRILLWGFYIPQSNKLFHQSLLLLKLWDFGRNPLQPGMTYLYPLYLKGFWCFRGVKMKQHRAVMSKCNEIMLFLIVSKVPFKKFCFQSYLRHGDIILHRSTVSILILKNLSWAMLQKLLVCQAAPRNKITGAVLRISIFKICFSKAATRGALWKKVLLEILQNSQENTCARVSFLIKLLA